MGGVTSHILDTVRNHGGERTPRRVSTPKRSSTPKSSLVVKFQSSDSWKQHFNGVKETKLVVIDFMASWCGPCKSIAPFFDEMAEKFKDASFVQIDVDELPDVAKDFKVEAMPTFVLYKKGEEVDRVVGAMKDELQKKIQKHYQ